MPATFLMRVRASWSGYAGGPGLSTFYFSGSAVPTAAEALEAVQRVQAVFTAGKSAIPLVCAIQVSNQVDVIATQTGVLTNSILVAAQTAIAGTRSGTIGASTNMVLAQYVTGTYVNGKRVRGRTFWGPVGQADVTQTTVTGVLVSAVQGAVLQAGIQITTPITHCVWHRPVNQTGGADAPVTGYTASTKVAVLRSRRD